MVRGERYAAAIHPAHAVGIAVRHQTKIVRVFEKISRAHPVVPGDRFGINPAEIWIMCSVESRDLASCAGEQLVETTRANSEQGFMSKLQMGLSDQWKIDQLFDRRVMLRSNIADDNVLLLDRFVP